MELQYPTLKSKVLCNNFITARKSPSVKILPTYKKLYIISKIISNEMRLNSLFWWDFLVQLPHLSSVASITTWLQKLIALGSNRHVTLLNKSPSRRILSTKSFEIAQEYKPKNHEEYKQLGISACTVRCFGVCISHLVPLGQGRMGQCSELGTWQDSGTHNCCVECCVGIPFGKGPLERPRRRWEARVKIWGSEWMDLT
jgi:hypothetical protein